MDKDLEAPCAGCTNYSNWVPMTMYTPKHGPQTLQEAIDDWYNEGQDQLREDFWTTPDPQYDVVSKPKHYMLFEEEGIEVRDVIEKLVDKVYKSYETPKNMPMVLADYVQMMQYLMRFMDKNGVEDLKKARWYLDKLIDSYDKPDF
jgi:hypothetical protein